jgi:hypothetical protein
VDSHRNAAPVLARSLGDNYHEFMKYTHETAKPARVREPVQVYLDRPEQARLHYLVSQLGATKSEVLRRGLEALERQIADPSAHPALGIIGIADHETAPAPAYDVAREHDRYFADLEDARGKRAKRRRAP